MKCSSGPGTKWTKEDCELLKQLWNDGAEVPFIAQSFGFTRNAVLGIRHLIGLPRRRRPIKGPEYDMIKIAGYFRYR